MKNAVAMIVCVAASAVTLGAQEKMMPAAPKTDGMQMAMAANYTGCVERKDDGRFTLTHVAQKDAMGGKHEMMQDKESMAGDSMAAPSLTLTATHVKLAKFVGQKVSVSGVPGADSLSVAGIKTIAKSCQ